MLEIELSRIDDEGEVWWSGECGLQGDSVGIDLDPEPDLAAVVEQVLEVAGRWADRYPSLALEWVYADGSRTELDSYAAAEGVPIPQHL